MREKKKIIIGGQAVIEGVLMKSPNYYNISIRKKNKIINKKEKIKQKPKFFSFFFFRGVVNLWEMLSIGIKALNWSAEKAEGGEEIKKRDFFFTILISFLVAIGLFIVLPLYLTKLIYPSKGFMFNLIDGIIRIIILILYIYLISFLKDVKTLFQYHGAEHKAVNCYEDDKALTLKNLKKYSKLHLRCGTSFLIIVLIISILVFSLITSPKFYIKLLGRVVLLPVIIGLSYELLKLTERFKENKFVKLVALPGLWIQKITTKEPNNKQLEVALVSLKNVLKLEKEKS